MYIYAHARARAHSLERTTRMSMTRRKIGEIAEESSVSCDIVFIFFEPEQRLELEY